MKFNKTITKAFLALVAFMGLASCSSDDLDVTTPQPTNAQVYFSSLSNSDFLLDENQSSVQLEVKRMKTGGSLTAQINSTDDSGLFNVPSSVTFADGSDTAQLTISFNFSSLESDKSYSIALTIGSEASEYGENQKTVTIKYAPWSAWSPLGWSYPSGVNNYDSWVAAYAKYANGGYEDTSIICSGELPTYGYAQYMSGTYDQPVFYRQSMLDSNKAQLLLPDWFYGVDLVIDWNKATGDFTVEKQFTGYVNSSYDENVYVADAYTYWHDIRGKSEVTKDTYPSSFDAENGTFTLNVAYFISLGCFGSGEEIIQLPGYTKADYSLNISDEGSFQNKKNLGQVFNFTLGADVASVKYAAFFGKLEGEELEEAVDDVKGDEVETTTTSESGYKVVLVDEEGDHTLVALGYDGAGNVVNTTTLAFTATAPTGGYTWNPIYVGDYVYTLFFGDKDDPVTDSNLVLFQCNEDPTQFKIEHWGYDTDFVFSMDESGNIMVETGTTGYVHPTYGEVLISDVVEYTGSEKYGTSYYENGVFNFNLVYFCEQGVFGNGYETFTLTGNAAAKAVARAKAVANAQKQASTATPSNQLKPKAASRSFNKKATITKCTLK